MTNKAGEIPDPGAYTITVIATDTDGNTGTNSFTLAVAVGDPDHSDNNDPNIVNVVEGSYTEGSGGARVASFTVRDEDLPIAPHPYGTLNVTFTATQVTPNDVKNRFKLVREDEDDFEGAIDNDPDTTQYEIHHKSADELFVMNADGTYKLDADDEKIPIDPIDYEKGDEVEIVVSVVDAPRTASVTGETDTQDITIDINDAADTAPMFSATGTGGARMVDRMTMKGTTSFAVDQQEDDKEIIILQLGGRDGVWSDPDTDVDNLRFSVDETGNLPDWIEVYGPNTWENVYSRVADITQGDSSARDRDMVVAIVIDRTAATGNNTDTGKGLHSFELTATDPEGNATTETISFDVTDTNVGITLDADNEDDTPVTITGDPNGLGVLTMSFDAARDPDLDSAADAALVVYTWSHDNGTPDDTTDDAVIMVSSTPQSLALDANRDNVNDYSAAVVTGSVGAKITATVHYYEVNPQTKAIDESGPYMAVTDAVDPAAPGATAADPSLDVITTATGLSVTVIGGVTGGSYRWQKSEDGGTTFVSIGTANAALSVDANGDGTAGDGGGYHYRVVYTYEDANGNDQTVESEAIELGNVTGTGGGDPTTSNALLGSAGTAGQEVRVNTDGNPATVQWQEGQDVDGSGAIDDDEWMDIADAKNLALEVTNAHVGKTLRAKVTYTQQDNPATTGEDESSWVRWVEYTDTAAGPAAATNNNPQTTDASYEVEVRLDAAGMSGQPTKTVMDSVAKLFFDTDGNDLTYTITTTNLPTINVDATAAAVGPPAVAAAAGYVSELGNGGSVWRVFETEDEAGTDVRTGDVRQSLSIDRETGKLTYFTDMEQGHDGVTTDGTGNTLTFTVSASDGVTGSTAATAEVVVRINVAPTEIQLTDQGGTAVSLPAGTMDDPTYALQASGGTAFSIAENVNNQAEVNLGTIDVMDQNDVTDSFGTHTFKVSDDRFDVVSEEDTGGSDDNNGSTWVLILKEGATFDYEADGDKKGTLEVTVTATDGGGRSKSGKFKITITNDTSDDPDDTGGGGGGGSAPDPTVPGLKDDPGGLDDDGPVVPPPDPGMFIDDLHGLHVDIDMLDDFVLAIDDIDIA